MMKKILVLALNLAAAMSIIAFSNTASAQLGSLSTDLVFNPVTPCRIMDTRNPGSKSGILVAGSTRAFFGWAASFSAQGGTNATCGTIFSTNTAAIVVNFTVVTPDAAGYITAFPGDATQPVVATVNFSAGAVVGNNATLRLNQTGTGDDFKIFSTANTHVVADIVGYYAKPVTTALECVTLESAAVTIAAGGTNNVFSPSCGAGYTKVAVQCRPSSFSLALAGSWEDHCNYFNNGASSTTATAAARCCRIPGR